MAFQQSPGIVVNEIDLTVAVPGVDASTGALAGVFRWGPVGERIIVDSEPNLVLQVGSPTNFNAETFFSGANFLAYTSALEVVRAANTHGTSPIVTGNVAVSNSTVIVPNTASLSNGMIVISASNTSAIKVGTTITVVNSTAFMISSASDAYGSDPAVSLQLAPNNVVFNAFVNTASVSNLSSQVVKTVDDFNNKSANADFDENVLYLARWPGALGNSLKVSQCDTALQFSANIDLSNSGAFTGFLNSNVNSNVATVTIGANTSSMTFNVNTFNTFINATVNKLTVGDYVSTGNSVTGTQNIKITSIGSFANVAPAANLSVNVAVTSGNATITTTASGFIGITNGSFISVWSNTSVYRTLYIDSVVDGNTAILGAVAGFTNTAATWAPLSAQGANVSLTLESKYKKSQNTASSVLSRTWEFADAFDVPPGQSGWVLANGNTAANDELHVVVTDNLGGFTGVPGTVLEKYTGLSRATGAKSESNEDLYYKTVINTGSAYVWAVNDRSGADSNSAANVASSTVSSPLDQAFAFGQDGSDETAVEISTLTNAWDQFASKEDSDISLIITGKSRGGSQGGQLANYLIDNIAEPRQDCVVFVSPEKSDVVNASGEEINNILAFREELRSTSYGFLDSGYKYQYDKYNDVYRYIPLNGDIAGLAARTDATNDAWWSFAGLNRGIIKNIVRLAWNPRQTARDQLYKNSVNPVVTFQGDGTLLFGDKTLLAKPSSFSRINIRRLFIVLEKSITKAARYTLFEFNDAFTRAQFRNLIIPFLRDVQGKRGLSDFLVVCDATNNPASVRDANGFVGNIFIQANPSINFMELNFINTPNGISFSEVSGQSF